MLAYLLPVLVHPFDATIFLYLSLSFCMSSPSGIYIPLPQSSFSLSMKLSKAELGPIGEP